MKRIFKIMLMASLLIGIFTINTFAASENTGTSYKGHIQSIGWQDIKCDGDLAGTQGRSLRVEALTINLTGAPAGASIKYQTYSQCMGWQNCVKDGDVAGTQGKSLSIEAIKVSLENLPGYSILYRAYFQNVGWQSWVANGEEAGTAGNSLRIEAFEVKVIKVPTSIFLNKTTDELIVGQEDNLLATTALTKAINKEILWTSTNDKVIQVDNTGKITAKSPGVATIVGTTVGANNSANCSVTVKPVEVTTVTLNKTTDYLLVGKTDSLIPNVAPINATSKAIIWKSSDNELASVDACGKVTAIKAGTVIISATTVDGEKVANCIVNITGPIVSDVSVSYQGYVQVIGWQSTVSNGVLAGTVGPGLRVEALKVNLVNAPVAANIKYQAYVQGIGWQALKINGQEAGTENKSLRIEALKISLENLPGYCVSYRAQVKNLGWQPWVVDGNMTGVLGRSLQIEAIEIKIVKTIDVQYKIHVQNIGWKSPVTGCVIAGTDGLPLRIEALNIKLTNAPVGASIKYQAYIENIGWQECKTQGEDAGTVGKGFGIEALKIQMINAPGFSVQYQVEVEKLGWQSWTLDGEVAGTVAKGLRIKAVRIRVVSSSEDSMIIPALQSTIPVLNSISYKLDSYLNITSNIQSVEARAVALHGGDTSNNCVYFSSETMRRIGVYVPTYMANTGKYVPYLSSIGLKKNYNLDLLSLGNICFTALLNAGNPTHTFVFMDWINPDDHSLAYVADNQGSTIHIRSMVESAIYDAFCFFFK